MRKPIRYNFADGQLLYAVLNAGASVHVSIELPDGSHYAHWSLVAPDVALATNEFVARTWGDHLGLMASAMLGTGWFVRTGRDVTIPADEINEVWRLSELGNEWLCALQAVVPVRNQTAV